MDARLRRETLHRRSGMSSHSYVVWRILQAACTLCRQAHMLACWARRDCDL